MEEVLEASHAIKRDLYKWLCCLLRCKWCWNSRQLFATNIRAIVSSHLQTSQGLDHNFILHNSQSAVTVKVYSKTGQKYFKAKAFQPSQTSQNDCNELEPTRPRCLSIIAGTAIIQVRSDSGIVFWRKTQFIFESPTLVSSVMLKRANERCFVHL